MLKSTHKLNKLIIKCLEYEYADNGELLKQLLTIAQAQLYMIALEKDHKGNTINYLKEILLLNQNIQALEAELLQYSDEQSMGMAR